MSEISFEEVAREWIAQMTAEIARSKSSRSAVVESPSGAQKQLSRMVRAEPALAWRVLLAIVHNSSDPEILAYLAAGPLEDLLAKHGAILIDDVEREALIDSKFREVLSAVWRNVIAPDVWKRVEALRENAH